MRCLDKFNKKMKLNGGSLRNENIKNSIELLKSTFADDASFRLGMYFWELGSEDYDKKESVDIRIYNRDFSNANGVFMNFQTMIDSPIVVGDVLYDSNSDEYMLCTESFNINDIHWQGKLTLCNWILKWQDKNGDILEYPCVDMNTTQYNSGEQSNKQFTIGSAQHNIMLPYDENTVILSSPQRFFLDRDVENPTPYQVTANDTTSYNYGGKGIVRVMVFQSVINYETDRIDLGICDYIEKDKTKLDNSNDVLISKSVISYNTTTIKSGGDSQTFYGDFFDGNGNEVAGMSLKWDVICDFKDVLYIDEHDNQISIGIDDDEFVDEEFRLVLSDANGNYASSLIVRIESLL